MQKQNAELIDKTVKVIYSCETIEQLGAAGNYVTLVYKRLGYAEYCKEILEALEAHVFYLFNLYMEQAIIDYDNITIQ